MLLYVVFYLFFLYSQNNLLKTITWFFFLVRLELHGFQERISSLKAGLKTWLDHLNRLQRLAAEYQTKVAQLSRGVDAADKHLETDRPKGADQVAQDIRICQVRIV